MVTSGAVLKDLMACNDVSQRKLARETTLSTATISRLVNDQGEPTVEALGKLADYFGVSTDYLLGRED